jgi:hypothetical protein
MIIGITLDDAMLLKNALEGTLAGDKDAEIENIKRGAMQHGMPEAEAKAAAQRHVYVHSACFRRVVLALGKAIESELDPEQTA